MRGHGRPSHGTLHGFAGLVGQPYVIRPRIGTGGGCNDCNENRGAGHRLLRRHRAVRCLRAAGRFPRRKSLQEAKELAGKTFAARKDRPRKYNVQVVNEDTGHCYLVVR
jgi:hypothetical protein